MWNPVCVPANHAKVVDGRGGGICPLYTLQNQLNILLNLSNFPYLTAWFASMEAIYEKI